MGFFVEPETVWIEFDGQFAGWKVLLKKEMDAGDQDTWDNSLLGAEIGDGGKPTQAVIRQGGLRLLELCVKKIVQPDGKEIEPSPKILRALHRTIYSKLVAKIWELNPPFVNLAQKT